MWKGIGWLLLMLAFAAPASAEPVTRALFVGIDHYLYSRGKVQNANFDDLNGAVSDVGRIKQALRVAYKLDLDQPRAGKCKSAGGVSITLTDTCATRDAIIDALTGQIAASSPGDTVLFYFAGHGSGVADDTVQDQASGYNSTILPTDARQPGQPLRDIFDRDLRGFADVANARGVNLVTMFDSCNSGTGLRVSYHDKDGHVVKRRDLESSRSVSRMRLRGLPAPIVPRLDARGPGGGYRVSFGAARDDEQAREVSAGDRTDGVFTSALVQAIVAAPAATFGDLATAVRMTLQKMGYKSQHPQAEGELQATLGGRAVRTVLFDAAPDATRASGGSVTLGAGSLLGMTKGSTFALFASETAALATDATPLATATVAEVSDGAARLTLDAPPAAALPPALVARETSHAWGDGRLRVALTGAEGPSVDLRGAIEALPFVEIVPASTPHDLAIEVQCCDDGETAYLLNRDDSAISNLGQTALPYLAERVRRALLPVYNVQRLRALVRQTAAQAGIQLCLTHVLDHDLRQCPTPPNGERTLVSARPLALTLTNASDAERYLYVLMIAPDFGVTQLIPAHHGRDPPIMPGAAQRLPPFALPAQYGKRPELYQFAVVTADAPLNLAALEQAPVRPNLSGLCVNWNGDPEADCSMAMGSVREGRVASAGQWTVTMEDAIVEKCECEP